MDTTQPFTYEDIDWHALWTNGRRQKSWRSKGAADWDKKAPSFAARNAGSPYISLLLSRLPLEDDFTVLDVGCGPGTLAIPLAERVDAVTAVDYSEKMLEAVKAGARQRGLDNIRCLQCSWEDDWEQYGILPADLVIASRSMNVDDLSEAIDKMNDHTTRYAFIADRIAPTPFDPDAFKAIGRPFHSGPDYIFTINLLYTKNIHPNVEILQLAHEIEFRDQEEALNSYSWMIKDINEEETRRLQRYIDSRGVQKEKDRFVLHRHHPPRWALIWWKKQHSPQL